jgi:hypothetical protein
MSYYPLLLRACVAEIHMSVLPEYGYQAANAGQIKQKITPESLGIRG